MEWLAATPETRQLDAAFGNAHHGADEDLDQREIDRGCRDDGNDDRQDENVEAVPEHRLTQRLLGQGDLDEIEVAGTGSGRGR